MFDRIMILQHKGGEYISVNVSGITDEREILWETIHRAEKVLNKPSSTSNVAFQILDSRLTKNEIENICSWFEKMQPQIFRLAIIGASFRDKVQFNRSIQKADFFINRQFIYDWDKAKDWLVGKQVK